MVAAMLDPRLCSRIDASDIVQDVLTRAAQRLPEYLAGPSVAFYPWLRGMAKERVIDVHRRHIVAARRTVTREQPFTFNWSDASAQQLANRLASPESSPSRQADRREMCAKVKAAMELLSPADRELLMMSFLEHLNSREIAEVLGVSEVTARTRLRKALERLSRYLSD
jgi:RNA polymerase sigma-70 factor (ECF subfamily)